MSKRRLLLSNSYPFPILLTVRYHSNLGGYLYTPEGQPEIEKHKRGTIFNFIKYFNKNYAHSDETRLLQFQHGEFTLYIWDEDVEFYEVYIDEAYWDDGNIGIYGRDAADNEYYGKIYRDYGETNLGDDIYTYRPGEIYMYQSN